MKFYSKRKLKDLISLKFILIKDKKGNITDLSGKRYKLKEVIKWKI